MQRRFPALSAAKQLERSKRRNLREIWNDANAVLDAAGTFPKPSDTIGSDRDCLLSAGSKHLFEKAVQLVGELPGGRIVSRYEARTHHCPVRDMLAPGTTDGYGERPSIGIRDQCDDLGAVIEGTQIARKQAAARWSL